MTVKEYIIPEVEFTFFDEYDLISTSLPDSPLLDIDDEDFFFSD